MTTAEQNTSIDAIYKAFMKIQNGLDKERLAVIVNEMRKIVPSDDGEVFANAGWGNENNDLHLGVYVSKPLAENEVCNLSFSDIILKWLLKIETDKLIAITNCLQHLEQRGTKYDIDGTDVEYSKALDNYVFDLFLFKE